MDSKTKKIAQTALLAALIFVVTKFIQIPIPGGAGYVNAGDGIVLLAGAVLPPWYAFFAAGIGSALSDVLSSYLAYAPATFLIKGLMALIVSFVMRGLKTKKRIVSTLIGGLSAELVMVGGYLLFESFLYEFKVALAGAAFNAVQGVAGLVVGIILISVFSKRKIG